MTLSSSVVRECAPQAPDLNLGKIRKVWAEIGLSTQAADHKEAEAAIANAYRVAGLDAPRRIVWCGSPFSMGLARSVVHDPEFLNQVVSAVQNHIKKGDGPALKDEIVDSFRSSMRLIDTASVKENLANAVKADVCAAMTSRVSGRIREDVRSGVTDGVWQNAWNSVWEAAWSCVWAGIDTGLRKAIQAGRKDVLEQHIRDSLKDCFGEPVKAKIWDKAMEDSWAGIRANAPSRIRVAAWENLWCMLKKTVWENIALPIGECLKAGGSDSAYASCYGQHDAYWLSFYAYFREHENLIAETDKIAGLLDVSRCAGWFVPQAHTCWVCERPVTLLLNQHGRLHAGEGPALAYPDGWAIHATDGQLRFSCAPKGYAMSMTS